MRGHFGAELRRLVLTQHQSQVTIERLVLLLQAIGVSISKRQVMRLLIDGQDDFLTQTREVLRARPAAPGCKRRTGSAGTTLVRHRGANAVCRQIGNDDFAWSGTAGNKSRLNFLGLLRAGHRRRDQPDRVGLHARSCPGRTVGARHPLPGGQASDQRRKQNRHRARLPRRFYGTGQDLPRARRRRPAGGTRAAEVVEMARAVANHMTRDRAGQEVRPAWIVSVWANVNGPGDSNFCHYHPGSFWSGTYYVDDGGTVADPTLGGGFEILDPRGPAPAMSTPTLAFAGEGGLSAGMTETIEPRPGLLLLFPSWLQHQVRPYRGAGQRISIAFNLRL